METATTNKHGNEAAANAGVADEAKEKAGEAAAQAREQVRGLAGQANDRARSEIDQRSTQAGDRANETAGDLRSVGSELRNQGNEGPAKLADEAADRIERVGGYLQESDADRILRDAENFGRRRPWAVLAGAAVAGLLAARVLKASSSERYSASSAAASSNGASYPTAHSE